MKLRRYLEFINESVNKTSLWKLSEDEIREYFQEMIDHYYEIEVSFGFTRNIQNYSYSTKKYTNQEVFTKNPRAEESVPAYWIEISKRKVTDSTDISDNFKFACSIIKAEANADISVSDSDGDLGDIEGIIIKGGLFYLANDEEVLEVDDEIYLFVKQKEDVKITEEYLAKFYNWKVDEISKNGYLYIHVDLEDMANIMLSSKSDYIETLVKGEESLYDYYNSYEYEPDIESMIGSLNKENQILLVKRVIEQRGNLEGFIDECCHHNDERNIKDEDLRKLSEDDLINFLLNERFYEILTPVCSECEIVDEIRQDIGDMRMYAHVAKNYKELVESFDDIVKKEFQFDKIEKEVIKWYMKKETKEKIEYKEMSTFYVIGYDNKFLSIDSEEEEDFRNKSLHDIFTEWCHNENFAYHLDPTYSDYGYVSDADINKEIRPLLISD